MINEVSREEIALFNELIFKEVKTGYATLNPPKHNEYVTNVGYLFLVTQLRQMSKSQLKKLFYHIGGKQILKISTVSTSIAVDSLTTQNWSDLPWRIIS